MASLSSLIIMSILCSALAAQDFQSVSACPRDGVNWKSESVKKNCQGDTPDYLCAAIENQPNKYGQICTKYGLTPANKCAVLNEQTYNLDSVDCKADSGCPTDPYIPSELWRYQICYGDFYGTTTMATASTTQKTINETTGSASRSGDSGSGAGLKAGVVVAVVILSIILIIVVVIGILLAYRKNLCGFKDKVDKRITVTDIRTHFPCFPCFQQSTDTEGLKDVEKGQLSEQAQPLIQQDEHIKTKQDTKILNELLKYLIHILKQELGVNDLKEKAVIHSKSINEHFSEPLRKDLQGVKSLNDYRKLDMSLVFALLRNFCEGIKPPSRGWDYEPPEDETHVGADIERIRSMWNKYCDNDVQFKYLDDVYNRIKKKYGTVAVHGDDGVRESPSKLDEEDTEGFEMVKEKIQSIKLNEDCTMKEGIVMTEHITIALNYLKSRNVLILKGVIGCGKTHALKAIKNHFQEKNWETAWVKSENIRGEISYKRPTIFLCDNLFGKFGASVFSQDAVNKTENALKEIESSKQEIKIVIGIHTHVYEEVNTNLKLNFLHQKNITVEMDNLSEAETLLIFKEQLKKGHCRSDSNCWFKAVGFQSVLDELSKNQGHVGGPFLSLMYCNQHELFSDKAFSVNPVQTLTQHFQRMRYDSPKPYYCLVYLMCVQQHNIEEELEQWAGQISVEITEHNLKDLAKISGFLQVDNKIATPAHELLTAALFKSAVETTKEMFSPVLLLCDIDVFLQLLRPKGSTVSDLYLEYTYSDSSQISRDIGKTCAYRLARMYIKEITHPLMTIDFVKFKYDEYLTRDPKGMSKKKDKK